MKSSLSRSAAAILTYLRHLVVREAGFQALATRGWATVAYVEADTRQWGTSDELRALTKRRLVRQLDVRPPGGTRAVFIYRITQKGSDLLAATADIAPAIVTPPSAGQENQVYLRDGVVAAITGLRDAAEQTHIRPREWVPGETGWCSAREISQAWEKTAHESGAAALYFVTDDMQWLVRNGFAEHQVVNAVHVYRLTPAGAALQALEWREPRG
jgi:DNA-binding PadR family transcriptional regulator